jgi:DNA modification methylase
MVAFALRSVGWYLRQDIIWHKPNPMPESVTDRCTKSHEYIFLLSKSQKYYYDADSIKQDIKDISIARLGRGVSDSHKNINGAPGQTPHSMMAPRENRKYKEQAVIGKKLSNHSGNFYEDGSIVGGGMANKRSVWTVTTKPYSEAHFATFPQDLIVDCIKAGCPEGGIVLDPFMGAFTTALVSKKLNRHYIGFELNPEYIKIGKKRLQSELGMFNV